jgi:hypothetical protein
MPPSKRTQRFAVVLAFVAAVLSFVAVAITYVGQGQIRATPLFGGIVMLVLALSGLSRLRKGGA